MAEKHGLSVAQAIVAQDLAEHPASTLQEVCRRLEWPKSSVSRLVDDLVHLNLAIREVPAENRRTVMLSVQASWQQDCRSDALEIFFPSAHGHLSAEDVDRLAQPLDTILKLLGK
jgi:DNA-binding MarR family transcriptional regulator